MAQTVLLKRSSVAGNVPGSSDLALGEIAVNTADGAVYIKKGNNDIVAVADNTIMHIDSATSHVGIGNTSPAKNLHITDSSSPTIRFSRDNSFYWDIGHTSSDFQFISESGGTVLHMNYDGNIGIGTTSPSNSLHVNSGTDDWPIRAQSTDAKAGIIIQDTNTTNYLISESYTLSIGNQASLHASNLNIKSTGNVGIGTTSPDTNLEVSNSSGAATIRISNESNTVAAGADLGVIEFYSGDNSNSGDSVQASLSVIQPTTDNVSGEFVFKTSNAVVSSGALTEKMRIAKDGNVGIGTTSPSSNLHIKTSVDNSLAQGLVIERSANTDKGYINYNGGGFQFRSTVGDPIVFGETDAEHLRINPDGNVGIGTTSPSAALEVAGSIRIDNGASFTSYEVYRDNILYGNVGGGSNQFTIKAANNKNINLFDDSGVGLTVKDGGNVGIGTSSPSEKLHVVGGAAAVKIESSTNEASLKYDNSTTTGAIKLANNDLKTELGGSEVMRILANGNVGIGTSSPADKLHVNAGDIRIDGGAHHLLVDHGSSSGNVGIILQSTGTNIPFLRWSDGTNNLAGIRTTSSGNLEIQTNGFNTRLLINSSGAITFNQAYTFPTADGSANQVLQTDGSGNLTFGAVSGSSGVTVSNNANNRVLTGDGTNANAEANLTFDGSNLGLPDNIKAIFGTGSDFKVHHDASHTYLTNSTGNVYFQQTADDMDIVFQVDDGSGGVTPYLTLDGGNVQMIASQKLAFNDNVRATFGNSSDLQLYHDGTHSYLDDQGTGDLRIKTNFFRVRNTGDTYNMIIADETGAVTLYHNGNTKLATKSDGVDITGELQSDSLDVDGNADISGNLVLGGNLTVNGTTTTLNSTTLDVDDINITVAKGAGDSSVANGGGLTIDGAGASLTWNHTNQYLQLNKEVFSPQGFVIGTTGTKVGKMHNASGVMALEAYTSRSISFGNVTNGEHVRIDADGKVGIGTTSPTNPMTIDFAPTAIGSIGIANNSSAWNTSSSLFLKGASGSNGLGFGVSGTANDRKSWIQSGHPGQQYANYVGTLAINPLGGNVGIGNIAPSAKLEVQSTSTSSTYTGTGPTGTVIRAQANSGTPWITTELNGASAYIGPENSTTAKFAAYNYETSTEMNIRLGQSRMYIKSDGKVGIGTTTPSYMLDIGGGDFFVNGTNRDWGGAAGLGTHIGTGDFDIYSGVPGGGVHKLKFTNAGNLGIGTSSPQTELEISAAQSPFLRLTSEKDGTHDAGDVYGELQFFTQETYGNAPVVSAKIAAEHTRAGTGHNNADAGLVFYTSTATNDATATERMRIESATGNVGIGTTTPDAWLQIEKDNNNSGNQFSVADTEGVSAAIRTYTHNGDPAGLILNHYYAQAGSGNEYMRYADIVANVGNGAGTTMRFITKNAANTFSTTVIDNNGNVGIGETNPGAKLHVNSSGTIGWTNLANAFILAGTTTNGIGIDNNEIMAKGAGNLYFGTGGSNEDVIIRAGGTTAAITIKGSNQRVGISKSDPKARFQVEEYGVDTTSTASSATTQIAIHSFAAADFRSARFTVQVTNSTDSAYHTTELLLVHNGTTANITEFGEIHTGSAVEATFDADISSGNVRLLATPASTDTMAFKVVCHSITT